jgi:hypothetical protein
VRTRIVVCAALLLACSGVDPAPGASTPRPGWVVNGGRDPRLPDTRFASGFAVARGENALAVARQRAATDLAAQLEVRIEHELRDVSEEKDGVYSYHVASLTRSTVDLKLSGIEYLTWVDGRDAYALAFLDRAAAAAQRRHQRDLALIGVRRCLAIGLRQERERHAERAVATYEDCRRPIAQALEHGAVARALTDVGPEDEAAHVELVDATRAVDEKVEDILHRPVSSMRSAAERLALQLGRQGVSTRSTLVVRPFSYGTADVSSAFGRRMAGELESALARHARGDGDAARTLVLHGVYFEDGDAVRLDVTVKEASTARLVASAGSSLPRTSVPEDFPLRPSNFIEALAAQRLLSDGGVVTGDLRVDVWTSRGRKGVVFTEDEEYRVYLRVNRPAWVRLVYVLQSGLEIPIEQSFYIDASRANTVVEYPHAFEVVPPFGVEHIHATAYSEAPPHLRTRHQWIDGIEYEVVVGGLAEIARTRKARLRNDEQIAESFVAVTTTPRTARAPN